jgi:isopentenyl-diphosphate delta-isomerase
VEFASKTTLLEDVHLVHQAAPVFSADEVDMRASWLGRVLRAPLIIGAMTGGTAAARRINRDLARVAEEFGLGMGLGSQRAMLETPSLAATYQVRDAAPECLLLGNIGLCQACEMKPSDVAGLMHAVGADGVCVHLNAAMELFQKEGDLDFRGSMAAIRRLAARLGERLVVKETGCGLSRETARRLACAGVRTIDVAGAGGASWVKIENLRAGAQTANELRVFEEWGIPTAASLWEARGLRLRVIASGGLRSGLDMARSLALGAHLCSCALPFLRAWDRGGVDGARRLASALIQGLRAVMVLTGCRTLADLRRCRPVITGRLREWTEQRQRGRKSNES